MKHISISLAYAGTLITLTAQDSATIEQLEPTTVIAQSPDFLTGIDTAEQRIKTIPGAASVVIPDDWTGRTIKPAEIFQFDPSVYAQSTGTGNDTRLSVRGSGAQRKYGNRGLTILQDGIPANHADGSFYSRIIDPLTLQHVEVYPAANGFIYGANQLGGAINFLQNNGINAAGTQAIAEYGSFETIRVSIQHGAQQGNWDYFAGYSYAESDGYRDHQQWQNDHFTANLGHQWSNSAITRLYFLYSDSDAKLPGSLTEEQFKDDPTQRQPGRDDRTNRDLSTIRLAQRTAWDQENAKYAIYTYYQYLDFDHLTGIGIGKFNQLIDYDTDEFGLGFTGENDWTLFKLKQTLRSTIAYDYGRNEVGGFKGFNGFGKTPIDNDKLDRAENLKVYLENETLVGSNNHFFFGAGWVSSYRKRQDKVSDASSFSNSDDGGIWRAGYLRDLSDQIQLYTNISQSFEAAPFSEAEDNVSPQTAQTFELGSRFQRAWASGQITGYLSKVDDEFVDVEIAPNVYATTNEDTTHKGIEALLDLDLTQAFSVATDYRLNFEQSYQLNDFAFDGGSYDGNQMPGIAKHVYAGRLRLTAPERKWNASLSADWLPNGLVADNANTLSTDGYVSWRIAVDYKINTRLSIYGGIDNLFDKSYVSSVTINPSINKDSTSNFINPADGRAAYLGARMTW
ncbi:MAG: TonB-dependent receptor [Rubritalea sp.]|uniref:TonB-dependent receptor family protein n=1 Tax=Rubritalea sp. TaxID=2109375 RepID=UPI00324238A0